ncbi:DUF2513 domain-containing protein [Accumulibacter sp.]|uniref:DUF2513 domain-containing protein n=1 Tax=Accumulibacter sp. TaxID=2053492 RepID=UPI0026377A3F|nr:DUF2513 domain-containing protein [Accumulibacter sp.]
MELIRRILFYLEERPTLKAELDLAIDGCDRDTLRYHALLLAQAGLIDFEPEKTKAGRIIRAHVIGLNWAGHEFLDTVRSDKIWKRLLKYAKEKGGALPFDLLKVFGAELIKESLKP